MFPLPLAFYLASGAWFWSLRFHKFSHMFIYNLFHSPPSLRLGLFLSSVLSKLEFLASLFVFLLHVFTILRFFCLPNTVFWKSTTVFLQSCNLSRAAKNPKNRHEPGKKEPNYRLDPSQKHPHNTKSMPKNDLSLVRTIDCKPTLSKKLFSRKNLTWALCIRQSDTASTKKICRHVLSEKCLQRDLFTTENV